MDSPKSSPVETTMSLIDRGGAVIKAEDAEASSLLSSEDPEPDAANIPNIQNIASSAPYADKYIDALNSILRLSQLLREERGATNKKALEVVGLRSDVRMLRDLCALHKIAVDVDGVRVVESGGTTGEQDKRPRGRKRPLAARASAAFVANDHDVTEEDEKEEDIADDDGEVAGDQRHARKARRLDDTDAMNVDDDAAADDSSQTTESRYTVPRLTARMDIDGDDLIRWGVILRKLFPGQLSSLRPEHRNSINEIVGDYLKAELGHYLGIRCQITGLKGGKANYAVPRSLVDKFTPWFNDKIEEMIGQNVFKNNFARGGGGSSPAVAADATKNSSTEKASRKESPFLPTPKPTTPPSQKNTSASTSSQGHRKARRESNVNEDTVDSAPTPPIPPPPADMTAWTDVVRRRFPDFARTIPVVSLWVTAFVTNTLNLDSRHKVLSNFYERKTMTIGLPASVHTTFLDAFENRFFEDGEWLNPRYKEECTGSTRNRVQSRPASPKPAARTPHSRGLWEDLSDIENDQITRYKTILTEMRPGYAKKTAKPMQVKIKKRIKGWLREQLGDELVGSLCLIKGKTEDMPHSYGVPKRMLRSFRFFAMDLLYEHGL